MDKHIYFTIFSFSGIFSLLVRCFRPRLCLLQPSTQITLGEGGCGGLSQRSVHFSYVLFLPPFSYKCIGQTCSPVFPLFPLSRTSSPHLRPASPNHNQALVWYKQNRQQQASRACFWLSPISRLSLWKKETRDPPGSVHTLTVNAAELS